MPIDYSDFAPDGSGMFAIILIVFFIIVFIHGNIVNWVEKRRYTEYNKKQYEESVKNERI